jgi:hypothetical protein
MDNVARYVHSSGGIWFSMPMKSVEVIAICELADFVDGLAF